MTTAVPTRAPAAVAAFGGCAALLLRPVLVAHLTHPALLLGALFCALGLVGIAWPLESARGSKIVPALAVGVGAFALGRVVGGGHPPTYAVGVALLGNTLAAVAEEAFFRRFLYGVLEPYGAGVAVVGCTVAFAVVHVPVYGLWVLPIDLAAGAILSWQRWATESWAVPALTHVIANVLVVM